MISVSCCEPCLSASAAQALASVKTYTWRNERREEDDLLHHHISTRPQPPLRGSNLRLLHAHCDVSSSLRHRHFFFLNFLFYFAVMNFTRHSRTPLPFHFRFYKAFKVVLFLWFYGVPVRVWPSVYLCICMYIQYVYTVYNIYIYRRLYWKGFGAVPHFSLTSHHLLLLPFSRFCLPLANHSYLSTYCKEHCHGCMRDADPSVIMKGGGHSIAADLEYL